MKVNLSGIGQSWQTGHAETFRLLYQSFSIFHSALDASSRPEAAAKVISCPGVRLLLPTVHNAVDILWTMFQNGGRVAV